MGSCMYFGRPPASKQAVKRYNLLVPDIFPITPPRVDEDLPAAVIKKIEKLGEYLSKNQQRATKVSRRLDRRIRKELSRREPCTGFIKIAVHAYTYLLAQDNVNFYTLELIKREDSVIRVLLDHHNVHMRILGAELLAHFLRQQNDADNLNAVLSFIPTLCKNCRKVMPPELENNEEKNKIELRVACLRGLREHVGLLQRLSADPKHLDQILAGVLDNLEVVPVPVSVPVPEETIQTAQSEESTTSPRSISSPVARLRNMSARRNLDRQKSTSMDFKFFQKLKIPEDFASASTPSQVASQVMTELGSLTKAAGNAEAVLQCLLHQLDQRNDWSDAETVQTVFCMMRDAYARQHQQFLLFTVLLRHAAAASALPIKERTSLIQLAIDEGLMQDIHLSTSVLVHCLAHLPMQLPPPALRRDGLIQIAPGTNTRQAFPKVPVSAGMRSVERHPLGDSPTKIGDPAEFILRDTILHGIGRIAERAEGAMQLIDTLLGLFKKFNWPAEEGEHVAGEEIPVLECVLAAAEAACTFPDKTGRLPIRKYEQALQEVFALVVNVSSYARALANKIIRLVLPLAPTAEHVLPLHLTTAFLSTMYYELEDPRSLPETCAELGAVFEALILQSQPSSAISALQLVHTLWSEAIEHDKAGRLATLDAPHRCAILMLCRSMVSTVNDMLHININAGPWTASLEPVMRSSLRLENAMLLGITAEFPSSLHQPCALFLKGVVSASTVVQDIVCGLEEHEFWQQEFPQGISSHLSPPFIPSNLVSLQFGTKPLPLSTGSSLGSSAAHSEVEGGGMHLSQQVACLLQASPSGKHGYNTSLEVDGPQDATFVDSNMKDVPAYTLDQVLEMVDNNMMGTSHSVKEGLDFNDLQLDINPIGP